MPLPDFIIAGVQKCGTTALQRVLRRHPEIYMPGRELHFFDKRRGPTSRYTSRFKSGQINGEKTPIYVAIPQVMVHIARVMPDVGIVLVLRDPVLRFASGCAHRNRRRKGRNFTPLRKFIDSQEGMMALWRGMYAQQVDHVLQLFDRVKIVFSEQMRSDPVTVVHDVQEFLGCRKRHDLGARPAGADRHIGNASVRQRLIDFYRNHNLRLVRLLPWAEEHVAKWSGMNGLLRKDEDVSPGIGMLETGRKTGAQQVGDTEDIREQVSAV